MRRSKLAFALAAAALATPAFAGFAASLRVPVDRKIAVVLTQTLSSATAHVGDRFAFATTKALTFGAVTLPKGTPGHGRLAVVRPGQGKTNGALALQVDSLDLPGGDTVWVDIDASHPPRGHYSDKHTQSVFLPLPLLIGAAVTTTTTGNMILDSGTPFTVVTTPPRAVPAPLLTAPPTLASAAPVPSPAAVPPAGLPGSPGPVSTGLVYPVPSAPTSVPLPRAS